MSMVLKYRIGVLAGVAAVGMLAVSTAAMGQDAAPAATADAQQPASVAVTNAPAKKTKVRKEDKVVQSKDTKKSVRSQKKSDPLASTDLNLPDKQLYDKAMAAIKAGRYDVARLDLQTLLNTYSDTQYQMRAKLGIADSWFHEGGTAALDQAETEYKDFITFFPNTPEAAEAQMRVGDIYFREMDKPDRDYTKAVHAEEEYRLMLQQFPDAPPALRAEATQKLRDVQEAMAEGEREKGDFYASRGDNWAATIARYKTVVDTYPAYSHMDQVLIGLGDAYEQLARYVRTQKGMPESARAELETKYDGLAADAYKRVVLEYSAAAHVEDAKDRLAAMDVAIPTPTAEQIAASNALENSRSSYSITDRASLLFMHKPDTVMAARIGDPSLTDPPATMAPEVNKRIMADYAAALNPGSAPKLTTGAQPAPESAATTTAPAATTTAPAAALQFQDVPAAPAGTGSNAAAVTNMTPTSSTPSRSTGVGGIEIIQPASAPAASGSTPAPAAEFNGGLKPVGPTNAMALPPVEKPAAAPDTINDLTPGSQQPAAATTTAKGKKTKKAPLDKKDESSSKEKPKKGLDKLNPL